MRFPKAFHLRHPSDYTRIPGGHVRTACGRFASVDGAAWHRPALAPYAGVSAPAPRPWEDPARVCPQCAARAAAHMEAAQ